jgi:hypothetical protein
MENNPYPHTLLVPGQRSCRVDAQGMAPLVSTHNR